MTPIPLFVKDKAPSALDTEAINKLVAVVNALASMTISPAGSGKMECTPTAAVLDLSGMTALITQLQTAVSAIQQSAASGSTASSTLNTKVNAIIASISNCTITATCDVSTGLLTVTIIFPNLPAQS